MNSNIELSNLNSSHKFLSEYSVESVEGGEGGNGEMMMVLKGKEGRVRMKVNVKNGKKEGVGIMVRENNTVLMELCFENDEANGEVIVYDKMGKVMERGMLKNGMKNGVFVRYDKEGRVLREKYYKNGVGSGDLKESDKMKGLYEERNEEGEVVSISEYGSNKEKNGVCYEFEGGRVKRKCLYVNGEMREVRIEVKGDEMIEYDGRGKRVYEGGYVFDEEKGLMREGEGSEYGSDGESAIYVGSFARGERNGEGTLFGGIHPVYIGLWKNGLRNGKGEEYDKNHCLIKKGYWIEDVFVGDLISSIGLNEDMIEYDVKNNSYNSPDYDPIFIPQLSKLKRMIIGKNCFVNTKRFIVDGLNELESLKIGKRCFTLGRWDCCNGRVIGEARKGSECVIVNCPKLHQIQIGAWSFHYYVKMELKNLPSLQILKLGGKSFYWIESFELKG